MRIAYSPCGQPEEGYNVFPDQEACEATCVQGEFLRLGIFLYTLTIVKVDD